MGDHQIENAEKSKLATNSRHLLPEEFYTSKGLTLDSSMKTLSAVGTGLAEGTVDKVAHLTDSIKEKPLETLWHVGAGAAVGIGLALANKKLALLAGAVGTCEMLYRGFGATNNSFDSVMKLATTGTGYEATKKTIASNFGQLSADVLAMTATGAIAGGITRGAFKLKSIQQVQKADKLPTIEPISKTELFEIIDTVQTGMKKETKSLQVLAAKEAEHEASGRSFVNGEQPFTTVTPSLFEGMSQLQVMSGIGRHARANNQHLDWGLTRLIDKFTHGADGDYIRMSAKGQSEMIDNLVHVSRNVSRSEIGHAANLTALSKVHNYAGRHQQELKLLKQSQKILDAETETLGYTPELKTNLQRLADAYTVIGEPAQAISAAERLVQISKTGQATERVKALNNLGQVCNNLGATDKSLAAYEEAVQAGRELNGYDSRLFSMPNSKNLSELHQLFNEASELDKAKRCLKIMEFWNS